MKPLPHEGEKLKRNAHSLLVERRAALIQRARRAFVGVLLERGEACADDVRALVPVPIGINPVAFGPVGAHFAELKIAAADGYVKTTRPEAHARPIQRWILIDRAEAIGWLASNPEQADPAPEPYAGDLFAHLATEDPPDKKRPASTGREGERSNDLVTGGGRP